MVHSMFPALATFRNNKMVKMKSVLMRERCELLGAKASTSTRGPDYPGQHDQQVAEHPLPAVTICML
jgi:hypothetical protein